MGERGNLKNSYLGGKLIGKFSLVGGFSLVFLLGKECFE